MKKSLRHFYLSIILLGEIIFSGCATVIPFRYLQDKNITLPQEETPPYPAVSFTVFSDPHMYYKEKAAATAQESLAGGMGKLLVESGEIADAALEMIRGLDADFVLIPGDLTETGNISSHRRFIQILKKIEQSGRQVYVIPGNHDIRNTGRAAAEDLEAGKDYPASAEDFALLYQDYGYGEALYRDPWSLSYVAEPAVGLWLLALDATSTGNGNENAKKYKYGKFSLPTLFWIEDMLERAVQQKKRVIVMLHYAVLEHFKQQKELFPGYLVADFEQVGLLLASYDAKIAFTGHFHSQDITLKRFGKNKFLFDIETGSLITFPCALRSVRITAAQKMEITTRYIVETRSRGPEFYPHAKQYLEKSVEDYFAPRLKKQGFSLQEEQILLPQLSRVLVAHAAGDEKRPDPVLLLDGITSFHKTMINMRKSWLENIWQDLPPPDNDVYLDLLSGEWETPATGQRMSSPR